MATFDAAPAGDGVPAGNAEAPAGDGVPAGTLGDPDLMRELFVIHTTRNSTFRHGSDEALAQHDRRMAELETEYLIRFPGREIDPARTRAGARSETDPDVRTGADQSWDPADIAMAEGRDPTRANIEHARQQLADEGAALVERIVP